MFVFLAVTFARVCLLQAREQSMQKLKMFRCQSQNLNLKIKTNAETAREKLKK